MVIKGLRLDDEVFVYIDDILVATESLDRHCTVLRLVLKRCGKPTSALSLKNATY